MIKIYIGQSIEDKCKSWHPLTAVKEAHRIVTENKDVEIYTNSTDFMYYICGILEYKKDIDLEIYIDGVKQNMNGKGKNHIRNKVFKNFNKSLDWLNKYFTTLEKKL